MAKEVSTQNLQELELKNIIPSPDNPRIVNDKSEEFGELVESIRAMGVIVPVHVRDHPEQKGRFELLAGERRLQAAAKAGRDAIGAICHGQLSDEAAFEITFAENFSREDLTPLEQGKAVATLMDRYDGDTAAVASKMGKSVRWVMQRVALSRNLSKEWQKAIVEDAEYKHWTAAHLQLIAAFPANIQIELLGKYEDSTFNYDGLIPVKQLEKELAERLMLLSKALWPLSAPKLKLETGVKACCVCQKRSSWQPGLFDDSTDLKAVKKNDRCLDADCWKKNTKAWLKSRISVLKASEHPRLACVATNSPGWQESNELRETYQDMVFNWKASKEGAKGAVPALVVAGSDAGQVRWIRPIASSTSGSSSSGKTPGTPTPLKERKVMLDKKRWFVVIRQLIEMIKESAIDKIVSKDHTHTVMALAVTFGIGPEAYDKGRDWNSFNQKTEASFKEQVLWSLWGSVKQTIQKNLSYCGAITQTPDQLIEDAQSAARLLGIDIKAMFKKVAEEEYPEPKGCSGMKADGTPKTKKKKATKKTAKKNKKKAKVRTCRVCGCTEDKACITDGAACHWIEKDLCSACEGK